MLKYETRLKKQGYDLIIGIDEAGRGPLAGPVVAAAVILKTFRFKNRIDDSKKLNANARQKAFQEIIKKSFFGIGIVNERVIERINILESTRVAMEQALTLLVNKLKNKKKKRIHIIIDGRINLRTPFPYTTIINGDAKSKTIASASILAKVTRDRIMEAFDNIYPQYNFIKHKGYPTREHRKILKRIGPCPIHRKTFCPVRKNLIAG